MGIDDKLIEKYLGKRRLFGILKALSVIHFIIGGLLIISITGTIPGILFILMGYYLNKLSGDVLKIDEDKEKFLKNLLSFFILYVIMLILFFIIFFIGLIIYLFFGNFEGLTF
uniref:DUF5362 domain-containing protein n=1 Tax=candidate division WOR-3 bacterium TaxID=2052148 RepID=A0A7C4Y503_UNCW3